VFPVPEFPKVAPSPSEPEIEGETYCVGAVVFGVAVVGRWEVAGAAVVVRARGAAVFEGAPTWRVPSWEVPEAA